MLFLVFKAQHIRIENMCFDSHWSLQKSLQWVCVCTCVLWSLINICGVNERMDEYTAFNHSMDELLNFGIMPYYILDRISALSVTIKTLGNIIRVVYNMACKMTGVLMTWIREWICECTVTLLFLNFKVKSIITIRTWPKIKIWKYLVTSH